MEMEVSKEALKVQKELDEIHEKILDYEKKHEEKVEESLSIYDFIRTNFIKRGFILSQKIMTEEAYIVQNTDKFKSLINETRKLIKTLHLFVLSEISHRKYLELKFKLSNFYYSKESKNKNVKIKNILEKLDEKLISKNKQNDNGKIIQDYNNIIEEMKYLENALQEEKKTGWSSHSKEIIIFVLGLSGWLYTFVGGFGKDFYFILFGLTFLFLFLSFIWKYISYGIHYYLNTKILWIYIFCVLSLIFIEVMVFGKESPWYPLLSFFAYLLIIFGFILIILSSSDYKKYLLDNALKKIHKKFFPNLKSFKSGQYLLYFAVNITSTWT